jgi:hypothetical protein
VSGDDWPRDWKIRLRYGRLHTPYHHYTAIAKGVFSQPSAESSYESGQRAYMGMHIWATSPDEAIDIAHAIGAEHGFVITVRTDIYVSDPSEPPRQSPYTYGTYFVPYRE